jgi:predicted helicase
MDPELARQVYRLGKDGSHWKVHLAQQDLRDSGPSREKIVPVLYRPFDVRYTDYTGRTRGFLSRPLFEVMRHMLAGENVALIVPRQSKGDFGAFVTSVIGTHKTVAAFDINSYFPLYLYPDPERGDLLVSSEPQDRQPNLNPELLAALAQAYGEPPTPKQVLHYIYAVLYAPWYRERYADFLRLDFSRIPFPADREVFEAMAKLGARLVALHLLRSPELDPPLARFEGQGDNRIAKSARQGFHYEAQAERVYINPTQYFAPVPQEVWKYAVGGYQVCRKWLKDRAGRQLTLDEIRTYCRIVTALSRTITLQEEIDEVYSRVEGSLLQLEL